MGLTHIFSFGGTTPTLDKNNKINWCPHSCTLASLYGKIQQRAMGKIKNPRDIMNVIKSNPDIAIETVRTVHNRIIARNIIISIMFGLFDAKFILPIHPNIASILGIICYLLFLSSGIIALFNGIIADNYTLYKNRDDNE